MGMEDFFLELVKGFELEASELVEGASSCVMELEQCQAGARAAVYDRLGRHLHTLKGSSATCGLLDVSELAHKLEDLLAPYKKGASALRPEHADLLLKGLDLLMSRVRSHSKGLAKDLPSVQAAIPELFGAPAPQADAPQNPQIEPSVQADHLPLEAAPTEEEAVDFETSSWRVDNRQVLNLMREVERLRELRLNLMDRARDLAATGDALGQGTYGSEAKALRVPLQRARVELSYDIETAGSVVELMEEHLKAIYSMPVGKALEPLQRVLRDTCRQTGKMAKLSIAGGELMLDRRILEGLSAPLVHLVRNAVDHGLEMPEVRDALGKHKEGALVIRLEQQGNWLNLEVSDDGKGLDPAKLREIAVSKGLIRAEEAEAMNDLQACDLIFRAGFSTATAVSRISGRGVGMDVVKSAVKQLRGMIEVHSSVGQGTRFLVTLPLTLGASPMMLLKAGNGTFGLPVPSVESVFKAGADILDKVGEEWRLKWQESWLRLSDLSAVLGLRSAAEAAAGMTVVVLQSQGKRLALMVEQIEGDAELVILPLPEGVASEGCYQGAAMHSGGELMLVLRPDWLIEQGGKRGAARGKLKALVVDDSLTARAMHRGILESGGYLVHAASSASQALQMLEAGSYDVIICDVSMEPMDGLEFTRALKSGTRPLATPVVLVSANDTDADREAARSCGAEAFISKRDCAAGRLLEEASRAISLRNA
jgi:two-component system chemotaxis sensor kinase CheA